MLTFILFIVVQSIPIGNLDEQTSIQKVRIEDKQLNTEVFLLEIADYFQGTSIYNFLDLENQDNNTKRIVIATVLSIFLIVVLLIIIQLVLDVSKRCSIELSIEKRAFSHE